MREVTASAAGASAAVFVERTGAIVITSANWTGETAALEVSADQSTWQALKDASGPISLTGNGAFRVAGGLWYRLNKASTRTVTIRAVTGAVT